MEKFSIGRREWDRGQKKKRCRWQKDNDDEAQGVNQESDLFRRSTRRKDDFIFLIETKISVFVANRDRTKMGAEDKDKNEKEQNKENQQLTTRNNIRSYHTPISAPNPTWC